MVNNPRNLSYPSGFAACDKNPGCYGNDMSQVNVVRQHSVSGRSMDGTSTSHSDSAIDLQILRPIGVIYMKINNIGSVHKAVLMNDFSALKATIEAGSDVNELDRDGRSPLFYAAQKGHASMVDELLRNNADVNLRDITLESPLHFAARAYQVEAAKLLVANGADVNAQDKHGNTPLSRAVYDSEGRGVLIHLLLSSGGDKYIKNAHGMSPLDLADLIANYDVKSFLK